MHFVVHASIWDIILCVVCCVLLFIYKLTFIIEKREKDKKNAALSAAPCSPMSFRPGPGTNSRD